MYEQIVELTTPSELIKKATELKNNHMRLVQIHCTRKEGYEIMYSFDNKLNMVNLRLQITDDTEIESISSVYSYAFIYENEMQDLFGVKIKNMNIDFKGNMYKTSIATPFK